MTDPVRDALEKMVGAFAHYQNFEGCTSDEQDALDEAAAVLATPPPAVDGELVDIYERFVHLDTLLSDGKTDDPFRRFASEAWAAIKATVTKPAHTSNAGKGEG